MPDSPTITVLYGGVSAEREVSIASGQAISDALSKAFRVECFEVNEAALPESLLSGDKVVFSALHGTFGEDGQLQALLEEANIAYCGSDAKSSRLCMDKAETKALAQEVNVPTPEAIYFEGSDVPLADDIIEQLGASLVVKPSDQGSSVGLSFAEHRSQLGIALSQIHSGNWMVEQRVRGRELTVGILNGVAMGVVEIISSTGVYDYKAKYTSGMSEYVYPAELDDAVEAKVKDHAKRIFDASGCRDFARVDFLLNGKQPYLLEVNTLPGMTATSLLPKSASCVGFDFESLVAELVAPAIARFEGKDGQ
ncbi:MAG: D-alanine--D-alanine ligase [Verrucomicrobiota bacterium]